MIRIFFTFLAIFLLAPSVAAQESRNTPVMLAIGDFTYEHKKENVGSVLGQVLTALATDVMYTEDSHYVPIVQQALQDAATRVGRITLSDGSDNPQSRNLKADCRVVSIGYNTDIPSHDNPAVVGVGSRVVCFLTLKDAATGEILDTHQFNEGAWDLTVPDAMSALSRRLSHSLSAYLAASFPVYGSILERGIVKKQKVKDVYISVGSDLRVPVGAEFGVYDITTVAGRESRKRIGSLKVKEVNGPDLSWCKVTKGGDKIQAAMDADKSLTVIMEKL